MRVSAFSIALFAALGHKQENITVLPLFHTYELPYAEHHYNVPRLLAYGRWANNKQHAELVKFCAEKSISLRCFGDKDQLNEFRENYKQATKYAKGIPNICISGKIHAKEEFEQQFKHNNIYINPSKHEGFSMPTIEAMAHSMPVLLRKGTAMDELITHGKEGYLFSDLKEIPLLIDMIMKNYNTYAKAAYERSKDFTYEKYKERYLKALSYASEGLAVLEVYHPKEKI